MLSTQHDASKNIQLQCFAILDISYQNFKADIYLCGLGSLVVLSGRSFHTYKPDAARSLRQTVLQLRRYEVTDIVVVAAPRALLLKSKRP